MVVSGRQVKQTDGERRNGRRCGRAQYGLTSQQPLLLGIALQGDFFVHQNGSLRIQARYFQPVPAWKAPFQVHCKLPVPLGLLSRLHTADSESPLHACCMARRRCLLLGTVALYLRNLAFTLRG